MPADRISAEWTAGSGRLDIRINVSYVGDCSCVEGPRIGPEPAANQISVRSDRVRASSISTPRYLTVFSMFV
jgi:hypothetical protein